MRPQIVGLRKIIRQRQDEAKNKKPKCSECQKNQEELELLRDLAHEVKDSIPTYDLLRRLEKFNEQETT